MKQTLQSFLILLAGLVFNSGIYAQNVIFDIQTERVDASVVPKFNSNENQLKAAAAATSIHDTLDYFFYKHYFRNSTTPSTNPPNLLFYTVKSPYPSNTLVMGQCGAVFLNSSNISVNGLQGLVIKNPGSPSPSVPVKLYLCNVDGFNLPIMPPLDSVTTSVSSTTVGVWAGGSFMAPVNVNGSFAVLMRCASTVPGDTVRLFLNNAHTSTATSVPLAQRYGEGLGIVRFNGMYQKTTDSFGGTTGNDYEFLVAPYVSFNVNAAAAASTPSVCNFSSVNFYNNSTPMSLIENRQFNFNKFKPYWAPTNTIMPVTDSIYNWTFTGSSTPPTTAKSPTAFFTALGNQSANLTVKYKRISNPFSASVNDLGSATVNVNNDLAPTINVIGTTTFCANSSITTTLVCSGSTSFTWAAPINTVANMVVITQAAPVAVYTVSADNGGCMAVKEVTVSIKPIPNVSVSSSFSLGCTLFTGGTDATLTGVPSGGVYSGDYVTDNLFTPPVIAGVYPVNYTYTSSDGCSNSATTYIMTSSCLGLDQFSQNQNLILYPNPTNNGITSLKNLEGTNTIEVYNIVGQSVTKMTVDKADILIDLSGKQKGIYFVKVTGSGGDSKILKIVNQN